MMTAAPPPSCPRLHVLETSLAHIVTTPVSWFAEERALRRRRPSAFATSAFDLEPGRLLSPRTTNPTIMRSVNKIILVGNVAADPEVRQSAKGTTITTFPVATSRDFTSNGEKKKVTDFHRVVAWGKLAEVCGRYLEKGKAVYVEGMILNRAYEKDGERRYITEVRADEVNMLSYKRDTERELVQRVPFDGSK